jgi:hypothetical protein
VDVSVGVDVDVGVGVRVGVGVSEGVGVRVAVAVGCTVGDVVGVTLGDGLGELSLPQPPAVQASAARTFNNHTSRLILPLLGSPSLGPYVTAHAPPEEDR